MLKCKRGELLHRLFDKQDWYGKEKAIVTTPDVLHLIAEHKYASSPRLTAVSCAGGLFVFDEFHMYQNLANFSSLLREILSQWGGRIALLSATPVAHAEVQESLANFRTVSVDFAPDSVGDPSRSEDRVFNHPLDVRIQSFQTTDLEQWLPRLEAFLPELPRPVAVIMDSVHRLQWLKRRLRATTNQLGFELVEWSGLQKDRVTPGDRTVVLGTSAIEVGIDMNFRSLVMEASWCWPSAIQRLGRVGRFQPGTAVICSRRIFEPYLGNRTVWDRDDFEETVLKNALLDPSETLIGGEMFRGDSYAFALVDSETRRAYFYDQSIFAMFEIEESIDDWRLLSVNEKERELCDWHLDADVRAEILLRDQVFPFWGVLRGRLRVRYQRVEVCRETDDGLYVLAGCRFLFEKGDAD